MNVVISCVFFFKQKTAYELRISDWSSDVCSSDLYLMADACKGTKKLEPEHAFDVLLPVVEYCCISFTGWNWKGVLAAIFPDFKLPSDGTGTYAKIGRAVCRDRGGTTV